VEDYEAAVAEIDSLIELVNRTWERRAEIAPDYVTRQRAPLMTVYRLLPQTNCRQCGEQTCYSFAIKLVASQKKITDCAPLDELHHSTHSSATHLIQPKTQRLINPLRCPWASASSA